MFSCNRYHLAADSRIQSVISHEEKKITLMLIFIIVTFFICQSPYIIWIIITAVTDYHFKASAEFEVKIRYMCLCERERSK